MYLMLPGDRKRVVMPNSFGWIRECENACVELQVTAGAETSNWTTFSNLMSLHWNFKMHATADFAGSFRQRNAPLL